MARQQIECPLCRTNAEEETDLIEGYRHFIFCRKCGHYSIDWTVAENHLAPDAHRQFPKHLLQARIREHNAVMGNQPLDLPGHNDFYEFVDGLRDLPIDAKTDLCLKHCAEKSDNPGAQVQIDFAHDFPLGFAKNRQEFIFYFEALSEKGLLHSYGGSLYAVTHAGWLKYAEIQDSIRITNQIFLAFSFNQEVAQPIAQTVCPALVELGFAPMHVFGNREIDQTIDIKIVKEIKKSAMIIADVTFGSNGVYYEAGLAKGLGIPVIFSVREDRLDQDAHFDTRQFQHITWRDPDDFARQACDWTQEVLLVR